MYFFTFTLDAFLQQVFGRTGDHGATEDALPTAVRQQRPSGGPPSPALVRRRLYCGQHRLLQERARLGLQAVADRQLGDQRQEVQPCEGDQVRFYTFYKIQIQKIME